MSKTPSTENTLEAWLDQGYVQIAIIKSCHGIKGGWKIESLDPDPDWLDVLDEFLLYKAASKSNPARHIELSIAALQDANHDRFILTSHEVQDRNEAEQWLGSIILAPRDILPDSEDPDTFRTIDLVGLKVFASDAELSTEGQPQGEALATVTAIHSAKGTDDDFLELLLPVTQKTLLVPFAAHFFPTIAIEQGYVLVEGLTDFLKDEDVPAPEKPKRRPSYRERRARRKRTETKSSDPSSENLDL